MSTSLVLQWNWMPHTWVDAVQLVAWGVLCAALFQFARGALPLLRNRETRRHALLIAAVGFGARLLVPQVPVNWYSGVNNVDLGALIFSRDTTLMPLPNQFVTFAIGFQGIVAFNILVGVVCAALAWHVARQTGYGDRVSLVFGLAIALTPMYVRLSASDSSHLIALLLWWMAALALLRLVRGRGGLVDQVVLFCAAVLACPIRIEAGLTMPAVVLFVARSRQGFQDVWRERRRWFPLVLGMGLGLACSIAAHDQSWWWRITGFSLPLFLLGMVANVLFLVDLNPLGLISTIYTLLIWYYVYHKVREHDLDEALATVLPFVLCSIPYAYTAKGMFAAGSNLPGASYATIIGMFLLIGGAKGAVLLYDRLHARLSVNRARAVAAVALSFLLFGWLFVPYRMTYAYMDEFSFLLDALPRQSAKVLAIFDPSGPGDYDCCLALPYPTFAGDFPGIQWQVLGEQDATEDRLRNLEFDYYYPSSLTAVDVDNLNSWFIGRLFPDPEMNAQQQAHLRKLQYIDEFVRANYTLTPYRRATVPAHTFSWAPFRNDLMTLTVYRVTNP